VGDVTLAEAALLAGIVKGPSIYSPRVNMARATARRKFVLDQMAQKGFASAPRSGEAAKKEPITLAPETEASSDLAPEVVDEVRRKLSEMVGPAGEHGGFTITTTIDPAMQAAARAAVRKNLDDYAARHKLSRRFKKKKGDAPATTDAKPGFHVVIAEVIGADDEKNTLTVRAAGDGDRRSARGGPLQPEAAQGERVCGDGEDAARELHGAPGAAARGGRGRRRAARRRRPP
jgi:penicillin-binding protein 1A